MAAIVKFIRYLQGSELVATFQKRCGLFAAGGESRSCDQAVLPKEYQVTKTTESVSSARKRYCNGRPKKELIKSKQHDNNSNYKYKTRECDDAEPRPPYRVGNRLLYCLFLVSAEMGNEVFYITFLPCIHWNLDPFLCRRLVNMWMVVMYIGQVLKDKLRMPRPVSPPVVKLETRVNAEYGMPSTHTMAATAISFTFLFSAAPRFQFQFEVGLLVAIVLSTLVGLSRLYTGMHSALDVICGALISATLLVITYPLWDTFDRLQLTSPLSPLVAVVVSLLLCYKYPELDHYSTTRGDTTIIMAAGTGCSVGYWVNHQLGETYEPLGGFPMPLPSLTVLALVFGCARFLLGVIILMGVRQVMKTLSLLALCAWYKVGLHDTEARRQKEIEVPYKFITYISIGLVNTILANKLFAFLKLL